MQKEKFRIHYWSAIALSTLATATLEAAAVTTAPTAAPAPGAAAAALPRIALPKDAATLLDSYCQSCHEEGTTKGDVRLDNLAALPLTHKIDLLNRMQEQVYLKQMPPKKKKQPTDAERDRLSAWISGELRARNAAKFEEKLRYPAYGNSVEHEKLFSGKIADMPYTPARRWLVSPQIFDDRVYNVLGVDPTKRDKRPPGVSNPFLLTDASGVRYYDNGMLDGGNLLLMLTNASAIADQQMYGSRALNGDFDNDPPPPSKKKKGEEDPPPPKPSTNKKLKPSAPAFDAIIRKKTAPTDEEMTAAVRTQINQVLRRDPTDEELKKHLELTRSSITLAGNSQGLKQMLLSVLLESEFLYRLEFGAGAPDQYGRKLLAPREAAYAISYALGDREPDAALVKAAQSGQLQSRADYQREVLRLLADKTYYKGLVDGSLMTSAYHRTVESSHPRIVRFFREFFGYPNAIKIFKDSERSGFYYDNPGRGTFGTAGHLVNEADMLVNAIVNQDQHVFENLLGTEEYFVAPVADAAKKMDAQEALYEHFKDTDWKKDPKKVLEDPAHKEYLQKFQYQAGEKQLTAVMTHITKFRDKNLRPNPDWNYAFGTKLMMWVNSYNIAPFDWAYPAQQPFKVPNRKGILTHPAWLIAHAQNTQTDPVVRGRWIREKLLAGQTPDVPITVEAVIPEDHAKTLRMRLETVTSKEECWKCHQYMNPLGVPFESFDDFGRFRTAEPLGHADNVTGKGGSGKYQWNIYKTLPVDTRGVLEGTGDPALDGPVKDANDLIARLAKSTRTRQSIIRYAFRFYMGRNEMLSDSKTLIEADNAYVKSGGSFKAVIVSLLTSDSFMYRK